jgi:hypothetical protein
VAITGPPRIAQISIQEHHGIPRIAANAASGQNGAARPLRTKAPLANGNHRIQIMRGMTTAQ